MSKEVLSNVPRINSFEMATIELYVSICCAQDEKLILIKVIMSSE